MATIGINFSKDLDEIFGKQHPKDINTLYKYKKKNNVSYKKR